MIFIFTLVALGAPAVSYTIDRGSDDEKIASISNMLRAMDAKTLAKVAEFIRLETNETIDLEANKCNQVMVQCPAYRYSQMPSEKWLIPRAPVLIHRGLNDWFEQKSTLPDTAAAIWDESLLLLNNLNDGQASGAYHQAFNDFKAMLGSIDTSVFGFLGETASDLLGTVVPGLNLGVQGIQLLASLVKNAAKDCKIDQIQFCPADSRLYYETRNIFGTGSWSIQSNDPGIRVGPEVVTPSLPSMRMDPGEHEMEVKGKKQTYSRMPDGFPSPIDMDTYTYIKRAETDIDDDHLKSLVAPESYFAAEVAKRNNWVKNMNAKYDMDLATITAEQLLYDTLAKAMEMGSPLRWKEVCSEKGHPGQYGVENHHQGDACDEQVAQKWFAMWEASSVTGSRRPRRAEVVKAPDPKDMIMNKLAENDYFRGLFFCHFAAPWQPTRKLNPIRKMYWHECGRVLCEMKGPHQAEGGQMGLAVERTLVYAPGKNTLEYGPTDKRIGFWSEWKPTDRSCDRGFM